MYALIVLFVFVIIPMAYFYFEAKDEEEGTKCGSVRRPLSPRSRRFPYMCPPSYALTLPLPPRSAC